MHVRRVSTPLLFKAAVAAVAIMGSIAFASSPARAGWEYVGEDTVYTPSEGPARIYEFNGGLARAIPSGSQTHVQSGTPSDQTQGEESMAELSEDDSYHFIYGESGDVTDIDEFHVNLSYQTSGTTTAFASDVSGEGNEAIAWANIRTTDSTEGHIGGDTAVDAVAGDSNYPDAPTAFSHLGTYTGSVYRNTGSNTADYFVSAWSKCWGTMGTDYSDGNYQGDALAYATIDTTPQP